MTDRPIEPPTSIAIALRLCEMVPAATLPNFERGCLEEVHRLLSAEPPSIEEARAELAEGMAHAFRDNWREDRRPETWLVAACALLMRA